MLNKKTATRDCYDLSESTDTGKFVMIISCGVWLSFFKERPVFPRCQKDRGYFRKRIRKQLDFEHDNYQDR